MQPAASPTPILDRARPAPAPRKNTARSLLIGAGIGMVTGSLLWAMDPDRVFGSPAITFASAAGAYYLVILLHELGHAAAARFTAFGYRQFAVGPFVLTRKDRGFEFRCLPGRLLAGGHLLAVPDSDRDLRRRYLILLLGGPLATALLFVALIFLPRNAFTLCLLLWNALVAANSWVPFYTRGLVTDAKGVLLLIRSGTESDCLAALLYVVAIDTQGIRPRDWPADVADRLAAPGASPLISRARVFQFIRRLDGGDPFAIGYALEQSLAAGAHFSADLRRVCFSEAAIFSGVVRRDPALARAWLDDARKVAGTAAEKGWENFPIAAIALAEGKLDAANAALDAAIALLDRQPTSGSRAALRERMTALRQT
jgi:hypothetical protein